MLPQRRSANPHEPTLCRRYQEQVGATCRHRPDDLDKLTEDELRKSDGHEQKLVGLVQERYAISRDEADKQVKGFLEKCKV